MQQNCAEWLNTEHAEFIELPHCVINFLLSMMGVLRVHNTDEHWPAFSFFGVAGEEARRQGGVANKLNPNI